MTGTTNEPFFQESRKLKRERLKWITILLTTNFMTFLLGTPDTTVETISPDPWPASWVEVSLNAEVVAAGKLPAAVSIINEKGQVLFQKAYLKSKSKDCSTFGQKQSAQFMLAPADLTKLNQHEFLRALPYSAELAKIQLPTVKKRSYEIRF